MIVVLSDLHLSESQSTQIGNRRFNRNLTPDVFQAYFFEVNQYAKANGIHEIDLVLAGDILEITRSQIWLDGEDRPYVDNNDIQPGSDLERTILRIVETISIEDRVSETLEIFRNIQNYIDVDVRLHFMPGNHDRLVNATPATRRVVREILGIPGGSEPFPNYLIFEEIDGTSFALIRHGHEYDPTNFALNVRKLNEIPEDIPKEIYDKPCLGDIITIEFGAALPWLFRQKFGDQTILKDPTLLAVYERLMEFDDVRPTSAWLAYLLSIPEVDTKVTWNLIQPSFSKVIQNLSRHKEFRKTLKQSQAIGFVPRTAILPLIKSPLFNSGIPFWIIKLIMKLVSKTINVQSQVEWVKREAHIWDEEAECECVVSGHSHFAEVSLISAKNDIEKYYINTGTWRNVISATETFEDFGRLKALTKVMIFSPTEDVPGDDEPKWAFRFMSGVSYGSRRIL